MAYLRLVRWPNVLIVGLIFLLAKTQLVDPMMAAASLESCLGIFQWILLALATMFIMASGNVVNDIFDQDIDRINRPEKNIIGKMISEKRTWNFYYTLSSIGLGLGIVLCWQLGNASSSLIFMLAMGGLYFYSYSYKRQFLIGNVVVALLAGLVPFMPIYMYILCEPQLWMQLPWVPVLVAFSFFSAITTLIREVIKDMEDLKGDRLLRCQTLPTVLGIKGAKAVVAVLSLVLMASVGQLQIDWWRDGDLVMFWYFLVVVQLPTLVLIGFVLKSSEPKEFHGASTLSKFIMLGGILSMLIFRTMLA